MKHSEFSALHHNLARQIIDYARHDALAVETHLSAQLLADHLGVSRTPVQQALRLLEQQGLVKSKANRGFFLKAPASDLPDVSKEPLHSVEDGLYWRLANDRIDDTLPDEVTEAYLMRRYDASRRMVVRVLQRLAHEGIIAPKAGRGWMLAPIIRTSEDSKESFRFRLAVEPAAFLEPAYAHDERLLDQLRQEQEQMIEDAEKLGHSIRNFEANARFHETLVAWSGNRFLLSAVKQHNRLRRLDQYRRFRRPKRIVLTSREHLKILDAVEARALDKARALLEVHLSKVAESRLVVPAENDFEK